MTLLKALLLSLALVSSSAFADLEIRAHYGPWAGKPSTFNDQMTVGNVGFPALSNPSVMGGDVLYVLPFMHFLIGARYETFSLKSSGDVAATPETHVQNKVDGSRTSVLAGYRLINWPVGYVGLIGQYGLNQSLNYTLDQSASGVDAQSKYKGKLDSSYGVGVEAGFKLNFLMIGAEMGYTTFKASSLSDANGTVLKDHNGNVVSMDFTGSYVRGVVGFSF